MTKPMVLSTINLFSKLDFFINHTAWFETQSSHCQFMVFFLSNRLFPISPTVKILKFISQTPKFNPKHDFKKRQKIQKRWWALQGRGHETARKPTNARARATRSIAERSINEPQTKNHRDRPRTQQMEAESILGWSSYGPWGAEVSQVRCALRGATPNDAVW